MKSSDVLLVVALVVVSAACSLRQSPITPELVAADVMQEGERMRRLTFEGSDEFNSLQITKALDAEYIYNADKIGRETNRNHSPVELPQP